MNPAFDLASSIIAGVKQRMAKRATQMEQPKSQAGSIPATESAGTDCHAVRREATYRRPDADAPPIEYLEVACGICAGTGKRWDGYRGSERDVPCPYCAGKGTIVTERER